MNRLHFRVIVGAGFTLALVLAVTIPPVMAQVSPERLLQELDDYPHASQAAFSERAVIDHEIGLGAIKKVRGVWRFKDSERRSGQLTRYTWQIVDGFTSAEVMEGLVERAEAMEKIELKFQCEGRACGPGAQWANRVFGQRILYGREDLQRYSVYALESGGTYRLVIYAAARTADRQYLQVDLLKLAEEGG